MLYTSKRRIVLIIAIDTREQLPYPFDGMQTQRCTLKAGDYSVVGYEDRVAVERKSHSDAWQSMSSGRGRFERCVKRLAALDRAAIVIECSLSELCERPSQIQRTNVASVVGGLVSYSAQYAIPVFFADNRLLAERIVFRYLASWIKHRGKGGAAQADALAQVGASVGAVDVQ